MRVFLTGATGFIGTAIVPELIAAGHTVLGLTRSPAGAEALRAAGAEPFSGSLEDPAGLAAGAARADAVIHCAFDHDFSNFPASCAKDRRAIDALGTALLGSSRPLVVTSGTAIGSRGPGQVATEDYFDAHNPNMRAASEATCNALIERGVNLSIVRLPQVHDPVKQGLITYAVAAARANGVSAYVADGLNRWPAAHVLDVARLYRLALERAEPGARYHAVAEQGIPVKTIAEVLGKGLNLPVVSLSPDQASAHFGFLAMFAALDMQASSTITQAKLDWHPTGPGLIADLERMQFA